ncbi:MAG TPA: hypothetical protein VFQ12_10350, partial [Thermoleophilaceae bacterium]|nr:hypothetical protein [Thermoleophilaceae bacterium]
MPQLNETVRRSVVVGAVVAAVGWGAPAAQAVEIPFTNWTVKGKLTVAKLKQDVTLPQGSTFNGVLETTTQQLTGHVVVPRFTARFTVLGVPADATLELVEAGPSTARVVLGGTTTIDGQSSFTIYIRKLKSPLLPLNLVGGNCRTSTPVVLPLHYSGPLDLVNGFTFAGTTTIPSLTGCGLATPLL